MQRVPNRLHCTTPNLDDYPFGADLFLVGRFQRVQQCPLSVAKLDAPDLELDFTALRSADVTGRARALGSMVQAGIAPELALEIAGLIDA